jgi:hypothetical protein
LACHWSKCQSASLAAVLEGTEPLKSHYSHLVIPKNTLPHLAVAAATEATAAAAAGATAATTEASLGGHDAQLDDGGDDHLRLEQAE